MRLGLRVNDPALLEKLWNWLPPETKPSTDLTVDRLYSLLIPSPAASRGIHRFSLLYADGSRVVRVRDPIQAVMALEAEVSMFVASRSPRFIFVHAGVVAWKGRAIVVPGDSRSGKTRLVEALVRAGATYYSDEYAVLDHAGRVRPYARPLRQREAARDALCQARALGASIGDRAIPIGLVVATMHEDGVTYSPRWLSSGEAALKLIGHTVGIRRFNRRGLATIRAAAVGVRGLEGPRSEAVEIVPHLLEAAERTPIVVQPRV